MSQSETKESNMGYCGSGAKAGDNRGAGGGAKDVESLEWRRSHVLASVKTYFFEDMTFESEVQSWFQRHCSAVSLASGGGEQQLVYTTLFNEYAEFMEDRLLGAASSAGCAERESFSNSSAKAFTSVLAMLMIGCFLRPYLPSCF